MNERIFEIDKLLRELAERLKNKDILYDTSIYNYLKYEKTDKNIASEANIDFVLDKLIDRYNKKKSNINYNTSMNGWLVLNSKEIAHTKKCIKLYINLPKDKIEKYSIKIFDHLNKKNIKHYSKISKVISTDSINIRIGNMEDAKEFINYVNKKCGTIARKTNPFLFNEGIVGIAYDCDTSYNFFISTIIDKYLTNKKEKNELLGVSFIDFKTYVTELYNDYFNKTGGIEKLIETSIFNVEYNRICKNNIRYKKEELILTFEKLFKILMISLKENVTLNDILNTVSNITKDEYEMQQIEYYSKILNKEIEQKNVIDNKKTLLDDYIKFVVSKNGIERAKLQLKAFVGNYDNDKYLLITSKENFRQRFINFNMIEEVPKIIKDVDIYVDALYGKDRIDYESSVNLINEYINYLGYEKAYNSLLYFQETKNFEYIEKEYRQRFIDLKLNNNLIYITENNLEKYMQELKENNEKNNYKL